MKKKENWEKELMCVYCGGKEKHKLKLGWNIVYCHFLNAVWIGCGRNFRVRLFKNGHTVIYPISN